MQIMQIMQAKPKTIDNDDKPDRLKITCQGADYMGVFSLFVTIAELTFESIIWLVILTGLKIKSIIWRSSQFYPLLAAMCH